ncbi:MAG: hypothetical protein KatS3mg027_0563 [Bacteroidia bacterium]|nr:MAG: hypothetical protein KatS3mg027_0563 [Bacteroidia bacterium]
MKTPLFSFLTASALMSTFLMAQLPVSTSPQNKKAVLEEFTGLHCGYCPDGHKIATNIYNADPNNVILINIHQGSFATPSTAGDIDFRTSDGNSIATMPGMGITGYPTGAINRTIHTSNAMAMSRSLWNTYANQVKTQPAYCNVALQGTVDAQTRVLTVQAQVYYTANSPAPTNSLTIMLLEDNIPGPQTDYGNFNPTNWFPDGSYKHNHVLRKVLTPTFGTSVSPTTAGSLYSTTVTYTVPTKFPATGSYTSSCLLGRLELVAFVTQSNSLTINAARGPLFITNIPNQRDIEVANLKTESEVCAGIINPQFWFTNYGSDTITTATFTYAVNGGAPSTYTWNGVCPPYTQQLVMINNVSFSPLPTSNTLQIGVASVNGNTDQVNTNDVVTKVIPTATLVASSVNMQMDFTQDQYGSEIQWKVIDEATGTIVAQDGPWSDLANAGTLLHTKTFTLQPNKCYVLEVTDDYGDGACCSYGNGNYNLKSGGNTILAANANYGKGFKKWFKTDVNANVSTIQYTPEVSIFPNPANDKINIHIQLPQTDDIEISIVNVIGQTIYSERRSNVFSDKIGISVNGLADGIYNLIIKTSGEIIDKKFNIIH